MPLPSTSAPASATSDGVRQEGSSKVDVYFSADVETDGPIPGPYSMLAVGLVFAGTFDGRTFRRPSERITFYRELRPISDEFQSQALAVNGLDREKLKELGQTPEQVMREAMAWIRTTAGAGDPVLVAFPLSFDWSWLYWYFMRFVGESPFNHSRCFDIKTAYAVKARTTVSNASRTKLPPELRSPATHTHNALDDAVEQGDIFARIFEWAGADDGRDRTT